MAFDVLVHITEDSQRGRVIQMIADQQHVTPEQAVEQIIDAGIKAHTQPITQATSTKTPAEMLLGLFSSPEDAVLIDKVTAIAYEGRNVASTRDIGLYAKRA